MRCTEAAPRRRLWRTALAVVPLFIASAAAQTATPLASEPAASAASAAALPVAAGAPSVARGPLPARPRYLQLPAPATPRDADELQLQFAQRLVAAHPDGSYSTPVPARLLAIPALEVELNADGSVRRIKVLRQPSTGSEATRLAIAAVRRAAPYGNVSRLPRPWKLVEVFLFDDDLRFKPRTLDTD